MKGFAKKNFLWVLVILILAVFCIYFLSRGNSLENNEKIDNIPNGAQFILVEETRNITDNQPKLNNPPKTREDYKNLLGKLDYNTTYDLFYDKGLNNSVVNYSENPIEDVISFMDQLVYWTDKDLYNLHNYWASPNESLNLSKGDDEDFAILFYALFENFRDKNSTCYLIGNVEFTGIFCYTPKYEIQYGKPVLTKYFLEGYYFDDWGQQAGQIWKAAKTVNVENGQIDQDIKISIRSFVKNFMMDQVGYCCYENYKSKVTQANKNSITFAYNRDNFYELTNSTSFQDFIYNIIK